MKSLFTAALLLLATAAARPALASSRDPERAAPSSKVTAARFLAHHLVAALGLPTQQALAGQLSLAPRHRQVRTPE